MKTDKIYFASDFHLGAPNHKESRKREDAIIRWLDMVSKDASAIYLMGDLFDFWHEYQTVIPKGFVRFLGKLAELSDRGIDIQVFTGNHDMWMYGYFEDELNIPVHRGLVERAFNGKRFLLGHGDGLGPGDQTYKKLKKIFQHPFFQWLFRWLHPDVGMWIANKWSEKSREGHQEPEKFHGEENEFLIQYCKEVLQQNHYDYFIFGHRHLPINFQFDEQNSTYINLGEWISQQTYAEFDGEHLYLRTFD